MYSPQSITIYYILLYMMCRYKSMLNVVLRALHGVKLAKIFVFRRSCIKLENSILVKSLINIFYSTRPQCDDYEYVFSCSISHKLFVHYALIDFRFQEKRIITCIPILRT